MNEVPDNIRQITGGVPVPDLGAIAAIAKAQAQVHPWAGIPIDVNKIPVSCLFDIFMSESIDLANQASNIHNVLANGKLPTDAAGRPVPERIATNIATQMIERSGIKATLALACATMAQTETSVPRWRGPDGQRESGYAATYYEAELAARQPQPVEFKLSDETGDFGS